MRWPCSILGEGRTPTREVPAARLLQLCRHGIEQLSTFTRTARNVADTADHIAAAADRSPTPVAQARPRCIKPTGLRIGVVKLRRP